MILVFLFGQIKPCQILLGKTIEQEQPIRNFIIVLVHQKLVIPYVAIVNYKDLYRSIAVLSPSDSTIVLYFSAISKLPVLISPRSVSNSTPSALAVLASKIVAIFFLPLLEMFTIY
jgi:hypothetical protein